jgi:hypothetical protein
VARAGRPGPSLAAVRLGCAGDRCAILAVAFFAGQIQLHQSEVLAGYEAAGAATFVVQLNGVADDEIDALAGSVRTISDVRSAETPCSGISRNIAVDTSFLVFRNEQQQEYLGARTGVLGIDRSFDLPRDYYVDLHRINPQAPQIVLGMPLLVTTGEARAPGPEEVLVPSGVADYVGVQPGAEAIVEFVYSDVDRPMAGAADIGTAAALEGLVRPNLFAALVVVLAAGRAHSSRNS